MNNIIRVKATEELLLIYFFKLYSRKKEMWNLTFKEKKIKSIINTKSVKEISSSELFECIKINSWEKERFESYIPDYFYYFFEHGVLDGTVQEHPFLYTNIKTLKEVSMYDAEIGINHFGSIGADLLDKNGIILKTIIPNLYDLGRYDIKIFTDNLIFITESDINKGEVYSLFNYKNNRVNRHLWT